MTLRPQIETILFAGPTASGKSAAALAVARAMGGVIVNADSMQVYRELRLLSARPSPEDEARVPHRLYGFIPVREPFSVGKWLTAAKASLKEIRAEGKIPIFVGGTGLYLAALEKGLAPIPEIDPDIRQTARALHMSMGGEAFHAALAARDPRTATQLNPGDTQRVIRAFEVFEQTGQGLAEWQEIKGAPVIEITKAARIVVVPDREWLYARCDARLDQMLAAGGLEEARQIYATGLDECMPAQRALGLRHLLRHLAGELPLETAITEAKRDTRRFAKRQLTWFRHQMTGWHSVERADPEELLSFLR